MTVAQLTGSLGILLQADYENLVQFREVEEAIGKHYLFR
jgi:hypothetical protein